MASVIWKGVITFEDREVPVKFMSLVEDRDVHFRLLHRDDSVPVEQQMVRADDDDEMVASEDVGRAVSLSDGTLVSLSDEDRAALVPGKSRTIAVLRFVPRSSMGLQWLERPYLLVPDDSDAAYSALRRALEDADRVGICRWTMRNKRYCGALMARDGWLVMIRMRFAQQVIDADSLPRPGEDDSSDKELKLARQLVSALCEPFDHAAYASAQRERLRDLLEDKASAADAGSTSVPERSKDLAAALEASLEASGAR